MEVAKETGISQGLMNQYKNGVKTPTVDNLVKISNYLNCSIDYLLGLTDIPNRTQKTANTRPGDSGETKLIEFYNRLNDQARTELINYAEYMTIKSENLKKSETNRGNITILFPS